MSDGREDNAPAFLTEEDGQKLRDLVRKMYAKQTLGIPLSRDEHIILTTLENHSRMRNFTR